MGEGEDNRTAIRRTVDLLHRVNRAHRRMIERRFQDLGIHGGQHRLLMELSWRGPAPAQKELARCMDVTPASVANMLKRLESGGYIERSVRTGDERCNEVHITPRGQQVVEASRQIFQCIDGRMLAGFSDGDIAALQGYFERILDNLRPAEDTDDTPA